MFPSKLITPKIEINFDTPNRDRFLRDEFVASQRGGGGGVISKINYTVLGRGSYGVVIKARYKGKPVAVKILEKHRNHCCRYDTLANEANVLKLRHENVVRVLKIISGVQYGLVIMERFDGYCLQSVLNQNYSITMYHRLLILCDIINGLCFCHRHRIVHLDVKPQNIVVCRLIPTFPDGPHCSFVRNYICKLCDFGSSVVMNSPTSMDLESNHGTIRYMAPEVLRGAGGITELADIFSFGITMWQLSEGKNPYESILSNESVAYNVVKKKIRPDSVTTVDILRSEPVPIPAVKNPQQPRARKNSDNSMDFAQARVKANANSHISFHSSFLASSTACGHHRQPSVECAAAAMRDVLQQQGIDLVESPDGKASPPAMCEDEEDAEEGANAALDAIFVQTIELDAVNQNYIRLVYRNLYRKCWKHEAALRPTAVDVRATLHGIFERIIYCK